MGERTRRPWPMRLTHHLPALDDLERHLVPCAKH
jgi:hypothetical protein